MAFLDKGLDKTGLARLWANITALVETKTNEAKKYTDDNKYDDTDLKQRVTNVENNKAPIENPSFTGNGATVANSLVMTSRAANEGTASDSHISMNRKGGTTIGSYSCALGYVGEAAGKYSFAAGEVPQALSQSAVALGAGTYAAEVQGQTAVGAFNAANGNAMFMVGNGGNVNNRSNAFTVLKDGEVFPGRCLTAGQRSAGQGKGPGSAVFGYNSVASAQSSAVVGNNCFVTDPAYGSIAGGAGSGIHGTGGRSIAFGDNAVCYGVNNLAVGNNVMAMDVGQIVLGKFNNPRNGPATADDISDINKAIFMIGCGTSAAQNTVFRIAPTGQAYFDMAAKTSGADFAEYFEWADGNPDNEDRRGLFVSLEEDKIKLANDGDMIIGVVSGSEAFVGNSASENWQGKYMTDIFGTRLTQKVMTPEVRDDETGEIITPEQEITQYVVNPDYDPDVEYISRENRKEWAAVGLVGQVVVVDDGTCKVGGYAKSSVDGIGTAGDSGYRVMKRIDENHIKVLVK